jgi:hypothetical protein
MLTRVLFALGVVSALGVATLVPREVVAADLRDRGRSKTVPKVEKRSLAVPEIDAQHAGTAVALVAGGIAVVLGRGRRKGNA